jgi:hypothetical protein
MSVKLAVKKRVHPRTTLAVALPVGTVFAAAAILGVFMQRRKANRKKTPRLGTVPPFNSFKTTSTMRHLWVRLVRIFFAF